MRVLDQAALTDVGLRRQLNEDNYASHAELGLWVVADGMGGHDGGEIASELAKDQIVEACRLGLSLEEGIFQAHDEICHHPLAGGEQGMGTTVVALQTHGNEVEVKWVGDSRVYSWDGNTLTACSMDQTPVQEWVNEGLISVAEARVHPNRNIVTQALGIQRSEGLKPGHWSAILTKTTRFLLCSDGLTEHVDDEALESMLSQGNCTSAAVNLLKAALKGGGSDNITLIVLDLSPE